MKQTNYELNDTILSFSIVFIQIFIIFWVIAWLAEVGNGDLKYRRLWEIFCWIYIVTVTQHIHLTEATNPKRYEII